MKESSYWAALALSLFCCADEKTIALDSPEARLVAYDEAGVERTSFVKNTDIGFSLTLFNVSAHEVEAGAYFDYCPVYEVDQFLLIYKRVTSDTGTEAWEPVGKAYVPPISCPTVPVPVVIPANRETTVCGMKWSHNPDNAPLGAGQYYTALSHVLEVNGHALQLDLRLDFEVR